MKDRNMSFDDDERETELAWDQVRLRNLKINIVKKMIELQIIEKVIFTRSELKDIFAFKEYDIKYLSESLFEINDGTFILKDETKNFIDKVIESNKAVQPYLVSAETTFIRIYGAYYEELRKNMYSSLSIFPQIYKSVKQIIPIIHWGRLPILNKYLLFNRERDPETQMTDFYDDPDSLKALLSEIKGNGLSMSNKSDLTLNREMQFSVYTRRWGHNDTYLVKRTVDGWHCKHLAINGKCRKDGNGGLFNNLKHDSVFFPQEGVEYALQELWNAADDGEIDFAEQSKRLQEIADWISTVEKTIGDSQPEWVNYY